MNITYTVNKQKVKLMLQGGTSKEYICDDVIIKKGWLYLKRDSRVVYAVQEHTVIDFEVLDAI